MESLHYTLADVFTDRLFGGNQLAVVEGREGLSAEEMQNIAGELNLSETVFVFPPAKAGNIRRLRIFTPQMELPMAGHPTIGAAYVLAASGKVETTEGRNDWVLEEEIGEIQVTVHKNDGQITKVEMKQPLPAFGELFSNRTLAANLLSAPKEALHPDLPVQTVSSGVPFLFIPMRSLQAVEQIDFRQDLWERHFSQNPETCHIFAFAAETISDESAVHGRMFAPAMGIPEDPATGAASGPLGAYLVTHQVLSADAKGVCAFRSEQGYEMGRPSNIEITISLDRGTIAEVKIGGNSVIVGKGELFV